MRIPGAALVGLLLRASGRLPLPLLHGAAALCGWLAWRLPNEQRRIAAINLRLCLPELEPAAHCSLLRRALTESAKTLFELGPLWFGPRAALARRVREVSGESVWREALGRGRGALILTPHLGAWELAGLYLSASYPLTAMYRPSRAGPEFDRLSLAGRQRFGGRYVPANPGGVRRLHRALRAGQVVGLLPDQNPDPGGGVFSPFFGRPALTMTLAPRLIAKHRPPVFMIYAERLRRGRGYRLCFEALPEAAAAETAAQSATLINRAIERGVRRLPAQYLWSYKRFKRRPPGVANPYARR